MHPILKLLVQRIALGLLLLLAVSAVIFLGVEALPGDTAQAILGQQATPEALIAWAKDRCANFRVPRYLKIVDNFESVGMTASGKVQKARLREQAIKEFNL